jgi:hypothetical protein
MTKLIVEKNPEFGLRMIAGFSNPQRTASAEELALATFYAGQIDDNLECIKILAKTGFHHLIAQKARCLTAPELHEFIENGLLDRLGPAWSDLIEAKERTGANDTFYQHVSSILKQIITHNDERLLSACLRNKFWQRNHDFVGVLLRKTDDDFFLKLVQKLHDCIAKGEHPADVFGPKGTNFEKPLDTDLKRFFYVRYIPHAHLPCFDDLTRHQNMQLQNMLSQDNPDLLDMRRILTTNRTSS